MGKLSKIRAAAGKKGGQSTSRRKARAARQNVARARTVLADYIKKGKEARRG